MGRGILAILSALLGVMLSNANAGELHDAVKKGDLALVKKLIAKGANVNEIDEENGTPLISAIYGNLSQDNDLRRKIELADHLIKPLHAPLSNNSRAIVKILLANGADVQAASSIDGDAEIDALSIACARGDDKLVDLLIAKGADIRALKGGALLKAMTFGNFSLARKLIELGAAPRNIKDHGGNNALFFAANWGDIEFMRYLIEKGGDIKEANSRGETPLFYARNPEVAKFLLENGLAVDAKNDNGMTPMLFLAIGYGRWDVVWYLIGQGADPTVTTARNISLLFYADDRKLLDLLISKGLDVNAKSTYGESPILLAAGRGEIDTVKYLLAHGADPKAKSIDGRGLLHRSRGKEMLAFALTQGIDVNTLDSAKSTPLHSVVSSSFNRSKPAFGEHSRLLPDKIDWSDSKEAVSLLVKHGADVNARNNGGRTPLSLVTNHVVAEVLLTHGAKVDARDNSGRTPLFGVISNTKGDVDEYVKLTKLLVAKGADIYAKDYSGNTLVHVYDAEPQFKKTYLEYLLKQGLDINARNNAGQTPLLRAPNYMTAMQLIEHGADMLAKDRQGNTALHLAVKENYKFPLVKWLVDKGGDVNAKNDAGTTPLLATSSGKVQKYLIQRGADVTARNAIGLTVLFNLGSTEVGQMALDKGVNVNARQDETGGMPLHQAVIFERNEIIAWLLSHGADVSAQDDYGYTPLFHAHSAEAAQLLVEKGADVKARNYQDETPLHHIVGTSVSMYRMESLDTLLSHGADINARDRLGMTPIFRAKDTEILTALLAKGADIKLRAKDGKTLLHQFARRGDNKLVELLIDKGIDIQAKDDDGMTALFYASTKDIVDLLVAKGLDVNARAKDGYTPLFYAQNLDVAAALVAAGAKKDEKLDALFKEPELVTLAAGNFVMGSDLAVNENHQKPAHSVQIKAFSLGKTEVTQSLWRSVMGYNPSMFKGADLPVERVGWTEVHEFIKKLNEKTGKHYRLPSEAEWEYACRAGSDLMYCGSDDINVVAWYGGTRFKKQGNAVSTRRVATKKANAWGLYDMSGNVYEWVEDGWHEDYAGAPADGSAWQDSGNKKVWRGGSWNWQAELSQSRWRKMVAGEGVGGVAGLRLAATR